MTSDHEVPNEGDSGLSASSACDPLEAEKTPPDRSVGRRVAGRYRLVNLVGGGCSGIVYKAIDQHRTSEANGEAVVAVKLLKRSLLRDKKWKERFSKEVPMSTEFNHPNLLKVYDFGTSDWGESYVVMEYVEGGSLLERIYATDNPLTFPEMLFILRHVARGLAEAHSRGILHLNLKPYKILFSGEGTTKVAGFGLARSHRVTQEKPTVPFPYYASPEQVLLRPVDERSDIYLLGIIAYEMATKRLPFDSEAYQELAEMHTSERLPSFYVKAVRFGNGSRHSHWSAQRSHRSAATNRCRKSQHTWNCGWRGWG